ncbi:MAG TPA: hydrogenase maturation peptidase HycI [archaeon]|nr:hydrogenase maturation peptidase HycI [archaeon]
MTLINDLRGWFSNAQRVVIVGVGNPIRRDDGVGVEIVHSLKGKVSNDILLIESETIPENFINQIIEFKPTHILIINAALMHLNPGTAKLVKSIEAPEESISTHGLPIQIFVQYLTKMTEANTAMLLIQPRDTGFGEGLTSELNKVKEKLAKNLFTIIAETC